MAAENPAIASQSSQLKRRRDEEEHALFLFIYLFDFPIS